MRFLWLLVVLALGCGPSQREIALAKTTRYRANEQVLFQRMVSVAESRYKLARIDQPGLKIVTTARWYNPEGQGISGAGESNVFNIPDRSIRMALVAELLPVDRDWVVQVRAEMVRFRVGQSAPDRILPNEILPGWIPGKVDQLQYEFYEALREFEVAAPGDNIPQTPPPSDRPSVDPDEPPPAAPSERPPVLPPSSEGSATPPPGEGSATPP